MPRLVIIESPYRGKDTTDTGRNIDYARRCMRDALTRGDYPLASHLLYTQTKILDDTIKAERDLGIEAGLAWGMHADATLVYTDRGVSEGMKHSIAAAHAAGRPIEYRSLDK